ncbi:DUF3231 family protein [Bacillus timonensis]|uniref:DUF3231 family protein n=1 Tax=Bacillus timonensis TaxID=1033734 RepID=A0A4S3PUB5_9BACI|nr:DUF3231 family protein [Bacillus timonensis]THE12492.1 DUF3231 family protein [Bacillus timonensis]
MNDPKPISLTASELGYLWTGYSINEMSMWYLIMFQKHSKDEDIKNIYDYALENTTKMLQTRKEILSNEDYPVPVGFSESDINKNSSSLFSDRFLLIYLHKATRLGLEFHSKALSLSTRADVRKYNMECLQSAISLYERVVNLLLTKGIYWRTPHLPPPTSPEHIQKSSYLNGWFGSIRPMNSMEIANLYSIIDLLNITETLFIGFAQTTESEEVVDLISDGVTVVKKQSNALCGLLVEEHLPNPPVYSAEITGTKKRVFSDRIIVTHMAGLFGSLLSLYGYSLGSVMKHDLLAAYIAQIAKAGAFSEKVTKFLIKKEWLEKVPGAIQREL